MFSRLGVLVINISSKVPLNTHFDMELNTSLCARTKNKETMKMAWQRLNIALFLLNSFKGLFL